MKTNINKFKSEEIIRQIEELEQSILQCQIDFNQWEKDNENSPNYTENRDEEYNKVVEKVRALNTNIQALYKEFELTSFRDDSGSLKAGALQLGSTYLVVPPSRISVFERTENTVIDIIRAPGSLKTNTGRQDIEIHLELIFPDLDSINNNFRPLLAQLYRTPFLPIENLHISKLINPQMYWVLNKNVVKTKTDKASAFSNYAYNYQERVITKGSSDEEQIGGSFNLSEDDKKRINSRKVAAMKGIVEKIDELGKLKNNAQALLESTDKADIELYNTRKLDLEKKEAEYEKQFLAANELNSITLADQYMQENAKIKIQPDTTHNDQQIGVAVESVSVNTMPGLPEAIQCTLSLKLFNYTPYTYDFSFLQTIEDSVKQIEYYTARNYLKFSKKFRELRDVVFYKQPIVGYTKNAAESEPFQAYIEPLLTGEFVEKEVTVDMIEEETGNIVNLKRGFGFLPTNHYLRKINSNDLKAIDIEFNITKLSLEDRDHYSNLQMDLINRYTEQLRVLAQCSKTDTSFLNILKYFVKSLYLQLQQTFTLHSTQQALKAFKDSLVDPMEQYFVLDVDISIKDKNGALKIIALAGKLTNMRELKQEFEKLIPGFKAFSNELENQLKLQFISEYGYQTNYKFSFKEDGDTIITGLNAGFSHKLAPIPLQAYHIPTYQHMGRNDWAIEMSLQTCNIEFLSIMRDINDKIRDNRITKNRSDNEWWISKLNAIYLTPSANSNGFFKLLGILNVLPDGMNIASIPEKAGWFNVTISFLQNDIDAVNYEKLRWINTYDNKHINNMMRAFLNEYKWSNDPSFQETASMYPFFAQQIIPKLRSYAYQQFFGTFYGSDGDNYPSLNEAYYDSTYLNQELNDTKVQSIPLPPGTITSSYSLNRVSPTHPETMTSHNGVDIVPSGDKTLLAPAEGTVEKIYIWKNTTNGSDEKAGNHIKLSHNIKYGNQTKKVYTNYFHLESIDSSLKLKTKIAKGTVLGQIGSTGDSTGTHLHFEIYYEEDGRKQPVDPQNQNIFSDKITSVGEDYVGEKDNNEYIVSDNTIQKLYNGGWKFADFVDACIDVLPTLKYKTKGFLTHEIVKNAGKQRVKNYSTDVQKFYDKYFALSDRADSYKEYGADNLIIGGKVSRSIFDICDNLDQKYINFFIFDAVKDINDLKVKDILKNQFFRSLVIQYISSAPFEFATLYNKYYQDPKETIQPYEVLPQWNDKANINGESYDLYSNYLDLELPTYRNSVNSTPTDFYFKRFDDIVPFEYVEEKLKRYSEYMQYSWKDQMLDGLYFNERILKNGEYKEETDALLNNMIADPIGVANGKYAAEIDNLTDKLAKEVGRGIKVNSYDYKQFIKNEYQQIRANRESYDIRKLSLLKNAMYIGAIMNTFRENGHSLNEKGIKNSQNADGDPQSNYRTDCALKLLTGISDINSTLAAPNENLLGIVTPYSLNETQNIINRTKLDYDNYKGRDKTKNMEKAFPTLKLFFIEEDSKTWKKLDDYYIYNSVESCKVIKSAKSASDLCEIVISNLTGNLTNVDALSQKENINYDQTQLEQDISKIFVSEGSTIMIKAGYDNNTEFLDRVFLGRVVSIQYGDRIKITAQSFAAELHEYVNNGDACKYGFFSACRTHGDVVLSALESLDNLLNFGSKSIYEILGFTNTYEPFYPVHDKYNKWSDIFTKSRTIDIVRKYIPLVDMYARFGIFDPRIENIYLPISKISTTPLFRSLTSKNMGDALVSFFDVLGIKGKSFAEKIVNGMFINTPIENLKKYLPSKYKELYGDKEISQNKKVSNNVYFRPITNFSSSIMKTLPIAGSAIKESSASSSLTDYITDIQAKGTFDWVIEEGTSLWNLLNEIRLYHLDYIVTVLPYNEFIPGQTRETIYLGPRDGFYKFTDIFDSADSIKKFYQNIKNKRDIQQMVYNKSKKDRFIDEMEKSLLVLNNTKASLKNKYGISQTEEITVDKLSTSDKIDLNDAIRNYSKYLNLYRQVTGSVPTDIDEVKSVLSYRLEELRKDSLIQAEAESDKKGTSVDNDIIEYNINNPQDLIYYNDNGDLESAYASYIPVVNYYYADSFSNIISNNITASSEELFNRLILKYPADPNTSANADLMSEVFFADDNILPSAIKTHISRQNNIDPTSCCFIPDDILLKSQISKSFADKTLMSQVPYQKIVGYNIMADDMRTMYRGSLILIGMPYIRPYDVILLNDQYLNMNGPIEVETVVHSFSKDGFTTTITPRAVISLDNPAKTQELYLKQGFQLPWLGQYGQVNGNNALSLLTKALGATALFGGGKYTAKKFKSQDINLSTISNNILGKPMVPTTSTDLVVQLGKQYPTTVKEWTSAARILKEKADILKHAKFIPSNTVTAPEEIEKLYRIYQNTLNTLKTSALTAHTINTVTSKLEEENDPTSKSFMYIDNALSVAELAGLGYTVASVFGVVTAPALLAVASIPATIGAGIMAYLNVKLFCWGYNKFMNRDFINIIGLWYKNNPMVAGVDGMYKDNITVHMNDSIYNFLNITADINGGMISPH